MSEALRRQRRLPASGLGISRRPEVLPLQIPERAVKLAVTDIVTTGKQCLQGCQECRSLCCLKWTGGVDDGE